MLSVKSIQRLLKPSRLQNISSASRLRPFVNKQIPTERISDDANLSRDQVLEIYDWIAQIKSQSNSV